MKEIQTDNERARQIVCEKPPGWEYLLFVELLRPGLEEVRRGYRELQSGLVYRRTRSLDEGEYLRWLTGKLQDYKNLLGVIQDIMEREMPASCGTPGQPGDPTAIQRAAERLLGICRGMLEWEVDAVSVMPPAVYEGAHRKLPGWTLMFVEQIERAPEQAARYVSSQATECHTVTLELKLPDAVGELVAEVERVKHGTATLTIGPTRGPGQSGVIGFVLMLGLVIFLWHC